MRIKVLDPSIFTAGDKPLSDNDIKTIEKTDYSFKRRFNRFYFTEKGKDTFEDFHFVKKIIGSQLFYKKYLYFNQGWLYT